MFSLRQKISELQHRPYQTRIRILWAVVAGTAILVILIWIITLQFRKTRPANGAPSKFQEILKNFEQLKTPWLK